MFAALRKYWELSESRRNSPAVPLAGPGRRLLIWDSRTSADANQTAESQTAAPPHWPSSITAPPPSLPIIRSSFPVLRPLTASTHIAILLPIWAADRSETRLVLSPVSGRLLPSRLGAD